MSNYIEQAAETTEAGQAIRAHLRQACEHKIALHVDAAIDVVDTDPSEADAWAYEAGKEAWEFDLQAPEKLASHPALSAAFKRGFDCFERQSRSQREASNYIEQSAESQDKTVDLKNSLGQVATAPFYIWANDDCSNKTNSFKEAKSIRLALFNEGGESVHIVDADGVEVVDAEIEAHEALVNAGYFAGARKPDVKPEYPGSFMVNDPLDPNGYAIVGDDIAALILGAGDHLIESASQREIWARSLQSGCL